MNFETNKTNESFVSRVEGKTRDNYNRLKNSEERKMFFQSLENDNNTISEEYQIKIWKNIKILKQASRDREDKTLDNKIKNMIQENKSAEEINTSLEDFIGGALGERLSNIKKQLEALNFKRIWLLGILSSSLDDNNNIEIEIIAEFEDILNSLDDDEEKKRKINAVMDGYRATKKFNFNIQSRENHQEKDLPGIDRKNTNELGYYLGEGIREISELEEKSKPHLKKEKIKQFYRDISFAFKELGVLDKDKKYRQISDILNQEVYSLLKLIAEDDEFSDISGDIFNFLEKENTEGFVVDEQIKERYTQWKVQRDVNIKEYQQKQEIQIQKWKLRISGVENNNSESRFLRKIKMTDSSIELAHQLPITDFDTTTKDKVKKKILDYKEKDLQNYLFPQNKLEKEINNFIETKKTNIEDNYQHTSEQSENEQKNNSKEISRQLKDFLLNKRSSVEGFDQTFLITLQSERGKSNQYHTALEPLIKRTTNTIVPYSKKQVIEKIKELLASQGFVFSEGGVDDQKINFRMQSNNGGQDINYSYNLLTGVISIHKLVDFDKTANSISFLGKQEEILTTIPNLEELLNNVGDIDDLITFKKGGKPENYLKEIRNRISANLNKYFAQINITDEINLQNTKYNSIEHIKSILEISEQTKLGKDQEKNSYQILIPIINSLNFYENNPQQLKKIENFLEYVKTEKNRVNSEIQSIDYQKKQDFYNPQELFNKIFHPEYRKHFLNKKGESKQTFGIGIFFTGLEMIDPNNPGEKNNILDLRKIDLLLQEKDKTQTESLLVKERRYQDIIPKINESDEMTTASLEKELKEAYENYA